MSEQLGQEAAAAAIAKGAPATEAPAKPETTVDAPAVVEPTGAVPDKTSADAAPTKPEVETKVESGESLAKTGNAVLDAGIEMMQRTAGLNSEDVNRIFAKAQESGDASSIDVAYIKERFPEHASYIEQLANAYVEHSTTQVNQVIKSVHEKAGGSERWELLNQTFKQSAPAELQRAVKALADSEDFAGAADLVISFSESSGLVPVHTQQLRGGAPLDGALSAKEFAEEVRKLRGPNGQGSLESSRTNTQFQNLVRRRALGKSKGL